ncbi:hypothetical protein BDZ45DRAFT_672163 [Acephala macrosclerotiorum]|nr:hypothetical protein BDZ45DRAFT_672163 [Acephala macrosclerotiorum]
MRAMEERPISLSLQTPVVFTKPADAIAGPYDDIPIRPDTQSQPDYEGKVCVIISKDAKNISESDALSYVLGYTVGNDVSARNYHQFALKRPGR